MIGAETRLVAMIGFPIAQVKSPANFNRHFEAQSENRAMIAMELTPEAVKDFIATARGWTNLDGFVVTIPHKGSVAELVDEMSPRARFLGAVNAVRRDPDGRLTGDMTDGTGFVEALKQRHFSVAGKSALVVGAGGAGSAISLALADEGLSHLVLHDLDGNRAEALAAKLRQAYGSCTVETGMPAEGAFDLVVNCSPMGMSPGDALPVSENLLDQMPAGSLAADVVTSPEITPFLEAARKRGLAIQTGAEMAAAQMIQLGQAMGIFSAENSNA